jgi:hypothetical protein
MNLRAGLILAGLLVIDAAAAQAPTMPSSASVHHRGWLGRPTSIVNPKPVVEGAQQAFQPETGQPEISQRAFRENQ